MCPCSLEKAQVQVRGRMEARREGASGKDKEKEKGQNSKEKEQAGQAKKETEDKERTAKEAALKAKKADEEKESAAKALALKEKEKAAKEMEKVAKEKERAVQAQKDEGEKRKEQATLEKEKPTDLKTVGQPGSNARPAEEGPEVAKKGALREAEEKQELQQSSMPGSIQQTAMAEAKKFSNKVAEKVTELETSIVELEERKNALKGADDLVGAQEAKDLIEKKNAMLRELVAGIEEVARLEKEKEKAKAADNLDEAAKLKKRIEEWNRFLESDFREDVVEPVHSSAHVAKETAEQMELKALQQEYEEKKRDDDFEAAQELLVKLRALGSKSGGPDVGASSCAGVAGAVAKAVPALGTNPGAAVTLVPGREWMVEHQFSPEKSYHPLRNIVENELKNVPILGFLKHCPGAVSEIPKQAASTGGKDKGEKRRKKDKKEEGTGKKKKKARNEGRAANSSGSQASGLATKTLKMVLADDSMGECTTIARGDISTAVLKALGAGAVDGLVAFSDASFEDGYTSAQGRVYDGYIKINDGSLAKRIDVACPWPCGSVEDNDFKDVAEMEMYDKVCLRGVVLNSGVVKPTKGTSRNPGAGEVRFVKIVEPTTRRVIMLAAFGAFVHGTTAAPGISDVWSRGRMVRVRNGVVDTRHASVKLQEETNCTFGDLTEVPKGPYIEILKKQPEKIAAHDSSSESSSSSSSEIEKKPKKQKTKK